MKKNYILLMFVLAAVGVSVFGQQSFEEWKRQQEGEFKNYVDEQDRQFAEFLEKEWKEFQAFKGMVFDEEPKPLYAPRIKPAVPKNERAEAEAIDQKKLEISSPDEKVPDMKSLEGTDYTEKGPKRFSFTFFDTELSITDQGKPGLNVKSPLSNKSFSDAWRALSEWEYKTVVEECREIKKKTKLNDWGYYLLVHSVSKGLFPKNAVHRDTLSWFLLVQSGYDYRIGYSSDQMYLLVPTEDKMYGVVYFYFDPSGPYYYFFTDGGPAQKVAQFYTYPGEPPEGGKTVKMALKEVPAVLTGKSDRELYFKYKGKSYKISAVIDENLVIFGRHYPQTDIVHYFAAPVSPQTHHTLINSLKLIVADLPEAEAANVLLRFVQTAFDYQTDQQQFGIEKPMFVEESLYYPYSDCEDRSIFYSYLVEEILGLDVIGLDWPGHIATAVAFSKPVAGDSVTFRGKRYVICDPTYINASIGMAMPRYKGAAPSVIERRDNSSKLP